MDVKAAGKTWKHSSGFSFDRSLGAVHMGLPQRSTYKDEDVFDCNDPRIKEDILRMILQYLQVEGFSASVLALQEESNVQTQDQIRNHSQFKLIRKAILEGDWAEVDRLSQASSLKDQPHFQYSVHKQQYLELIEQLDYQKAFTLLGKRLKPLEHHGALHDEFKDLCYLLTCRAVQDAPSFKSWEGISASREKLVEHVSAMLNLNSDMIAGPQHEMQQNRLLHLLRQAVRYQIEFSRYHPKTMPRIGTLLDDYSCFVLPNANKTTFSGHKQNVKCVDFVGDEGSLIASGSSDNSVRVWDAESGSCVAVLGGAMAPSSTAAAAATTSAAASSAAMAGHTSRVWDVSSSAAGDVLASASGDSTVKLWDMRGVGSDSHGSPPSFACTSTLTGHEGDVYSVKFHPASGLVATGGYDKSVRVWDVRTGLPIHCLTGHNASVSRVIFSPQGNLIVSGSKDNTIKFWDLASGVCVKTLSSHLGEVTSVELNKSGHLLLSGSKDNSNRLWDVRLAKPIQRFKGHQNTSKNFVRAGFGPNEELVVGGSEDGFVYIWDASTGVLLQRLGLGSDEGHTGTVYRAVWNTNQSLLASCSHDSTVKTWWYNDKMPFILE